MLFVTAVSMKIKVLLNRMQNMKQECGGAAKSSEWGLRLLEPKSGP